MRRASILVFLLLSASLLAIPGSFAGASPAQREAAASQADPDISIEFELGAGQGLRAQLETYADTVTLTILGHHQYVSYQVKGELSPSGLVAKFGQLGEVSVTFSPTKTISSQQPPKGCKKDEASTDREGIFSGTIKLTGEREYVRLDATEAKGEMVVMPNWHCGSRKGKNVVPSPPVVTHRASTSKEDVATLKASSRVSGGGFSAAAVRGPKGRNYTFFAGGLSEHRESMKIFRLAALSAPTSTFLFNHAKGTASVHPPWPFRGSASFKRRRKGPPAWRGSLKVALLGADPIALTGPGYRASLVRDFPGD
ncbi:MAG TPA: hypothetical protein VN758_06365 [Solirubrobacterales bacterium]|nr:hypothetical protein [Solirubrobacterales bacterium]